MPGVARVRRLPVFAATALACVGLAGPARASGFASPLPAAAVRLPAGARDAGVVPAQSQVQATVALAPRDPRALTAYAAAVSDPHSNAYHHYLSVSAFARRFAPRGAVVAAVRARLSARGLAVGRPTANGLALPLHARASVAEAALATPIHRFILHGGASTDVAVARARVGGGLDGSIEGIVGLRGVAPSASLLSGAGRGTPPAHAASGGNVAHATSCAAARDAADAGGSHTAEQIAAAYGIANLRAAGDLGAGQTIAVYELEPFSASDVAAYQTCMGSGATIVTEPVDGGAGTGAGSGEAAMDVEDLMGLAPRATIRVYEGPRTGVGAYDTYSAIVSDDAASVISTSWGLCEALAGTATTQAENTLLQEAAVQGQTFVAASGDAGADDCGTGRASVDDPASQPWATAVGGTSLRPSGDVVWNNALGASGGGVSALWPRPSWQGTGVGLTREVPDLSADADPDTGYTAYYAGAWRTVGGTSVAAPTVAALFALADAAPGCAGRRLGFVNPTLYGAAAGDFRDVTSGSTSYDGVAGSAAGAGYDTASGLGTPTAGLGPALCGDAATVAVPAVQRWSTRVRVALSLTASSRTGAAISFSASGLPKGVSLRAATGHITGTPARGGRYVITVTALDANGATARARFTATVVGTTADRRAARAHVRRAHRR